MAGQPPPGYAYGYLDSYGIEPAGGDFSKTPMTGRYQWDTSGAAVGAQAAAEVDKRQPAGYDYGGVGRKTPAGYGYEEMMSREHAPPPPRPRADAPGGYGYQDFSDYPSLPPPPAPGAGRKRRAGGYGYDNYFGGRPPPPHGGGGRGGGGYDYGGYDDYGYDDPYAQHQPRPPMYRGGPPPPPRGGGGGPRGGGRRSGGFGGGPMLTRPNEPKFTPKSLYQVLKVATQKQMWVEARKADGSVYYFSPLNSSIAQDDVKPGDFTITLDNLYAKLDEFQPATLLIKGRLEELNEQLLENYFRAFGDIHFIKLAWRSDMYPTHAFLRMNGIAGQRRLLAHRGPHYIAGQQVRIQAPRQRILVSRIPDSTSKMDILRFFSEEGRQLESSAYVIDTYRPMPFTQFAFVVFGEERGAVGEQLAALHQMEYVGGETLQVMHAPHGALMGNSSAIDGGGAIGDGEKPTEAQLETEFTQAVEIARSQSDAKAAALEAIRDDVMTVARQLIGFRPTDLDPTTTPMAHVLRSLSDAFATGTDDKLRKYVIVQEHAFALCLFAFQGRSGEIDGANGNTS